MLVSISNFEEVWICYFLALSAFSFKYQFYD